MYVVLVKFRVSPEFADTFRQLVIQQAENSLALEPGCHRFDVAFSPDDPTSCLLYELYDNRTAFDMHLESAHFINFNEAVSEGVLSKDVTFWNLMS